MSSDIFCKDLLPVSLLCTGSLCVSTYLVKALKVSMTLMLPLDSVKHLGSDAEPSKYEGQIAAFVVFVQFEPHEDRRSLLLFLKSISKVIRSR
jgi:hypothetical protein